MERNQVYLLKYWTEGLGWGSALWFKYLSKNTIYNQAEKQQ